MARKCPICQNVITGTEAACPKCGFKLSGSTQAFSPVLMDQSTEDKSDAKALLRVVRGPQVGAVYKLDKNEITLGRNPQCDIFLNDMTVSRMHAAIERTPSGFIIKDVDSYNGVWVNNQNVAERVLKPGDAIQIGKFAFTFELS